MKIQKLLQDNYSIAAIIETKNGNDTCPVTDFFDNIDNKYQSSADGMYALISHIAENGLQNVSSKLCHLVDKENKIFELIKGDLRLFFFKGHKDLIIIGTHAIIKKSQKTKKSDSEKVKRYKDKYTTAHDHKKLTILDILEE